LEELPVKHWAMRHARYHVLVVDHSKFGKVRPARMGALAKFDVIASDICPDDELVALGGRQLFGEDSDENQVIDTQHQFDNHQRDETCPD
ncbi:hypothetical protein GP979_34755, partial [Escherichia coli]|nr:hypothetical protein [Escherichia coli]